ncbi:MAG: serine/threonine-protein kinase, partial [Phycisphaerales bacterium]
FSLRFGAVLGGDSVQAPQPEGSPSIHGYRICEEIARGGQGVVYRAEQTLTGKTVAIKVLHSVSNATARARLHREMQIIAALDHPVIVGLHDSVRLSDGREALVMEHISGTPITQWSDRQQPDLGTRLRVLAEVAEGLHHAHERGVVHRDLTPSNILIDQLGNPRLLDFGVARLLARDATQAALTRTGEFTGTLAYSAPEQVSGETGAADARSDIYSLGVIGYKILTGDMPYAVDGPLEEVIRSIISHELPSRSRSRLGADPWTVLHRAMQKDPNRRYKDAAAFAQDLRRAAEGQAISARASSPGYRLSVTFRRHRKLYAASILLMAASITIVSVSSDRVYRTDRARVRSELATLLATGSRVGAEALLWQELDRIAPTSADPLDLMWNADLDTRSLVWAFAEMQSEALCLASDRSLQTPPLSIIALDSGDFGVIAADRTVYLARTEGHGISLVKGPRLDPTIRYARFVPDRDWIIAITASALHVLD